MQIKLECNNISSLPDLLREIASQIELTGLEQGVYPKWKILSAGEEISMTESQYEDFENHLERELTSFKESAIDKLREIIEFS